MDFNGMKDKWKSFVGDMNAKGIPMPMVRDPKTGRGSVSLTLLFISFNVWLVSIIGKAAGALGGVNPEQTLNMFLVCSGLYFGRRLQKDGTKVELAAEDKKDQ